MMGSVRVERRRQLCRRCGQVMFEYFRSPDGHYGLVSSLRHAGRELAVGHGEIRCSTCGGRYRLLDRLDASGQPIHRV